MTRTVEPADIVRVTELSGDRNPLHYDADVAARTRFGEIVVQGRVDERHPQRGRRGAAPGPGTVFARDALALPGADRDPATPSPARTR